MPSHNKIKIPFEVGGRLARLFRRGRRYEAVGFLSEGEWSVANEEVFARTAVENDGAIDDEHEVEFLREHLDQLPVKLRQYHLVTNRRCPGDSQQIACFYYYERWSQTWIPLYPGRDFYLVVRRCA